MSENKDQPYTLRWGVIGTGLIASWFVSDLVLDPSTHRKEQEIVHRVTAIGSSSIAKGTAFAEKHISASKNARPKVYDNYEAVYNDPEVDIVYIATPHALHAKNALDAIHAGKHVLCEKPMTMNAREAEKVIAAAQEKGVFLMEAVWTRFFPLSLQLQSLLHTSRTIGRITRLMVDFGLDMPLDMQPPGSRIADVKLGAGALLDIGIYPLTWSAMILSSAPENGAEEPDVTSSLTLDPKTGADSICSIILSYHKLSAQAICTASYNCKSPSEFARIEGTEGTIIIEGPAASKPLALIVRQKGKDEERIEFPVRGRGFFYEADAVAKDIRAGRKQNPIMPWSETVRMMRLMDGVRKTARLRYPQDGGEC